MKQLFCICAALGIVLGMATYARSDAIYCLDTSLGDIRRANAWANDGLWD